jgi:hypothetical protein
MTNAQIHRDIVGFEKLSTLAATAVRHQEMIYGELGPVAGEQAAHGGRQRRLGQKSHRDHSRVVAPGQFAPGTDGP